MIFINYEWVRSQEVSNVAILVTVQTVPVLTFILPFLVNIVLFGCYCVFTSGTVITGRQSGLTPPLLRSFTSKLLCWFPEQQLTWNQFDESAVLTVSDPPPLSHTHTHTPHTQQLSMPEGLLFKKNLADQLSTVYHSFLITRENGTHSYGNVLTFYEPVREAKILNMLESLQVKYLQKRHSLNSADEQHCFTRGKDTLYAPKCLCLLSSEPIHEPLRAFLEQLHSVTIGEHVTQLTIESYLYNLLYEVAMPSPGKQVNFSGI